MIWNSATEYEAFGALDQQGRAYVGFRAKDDGRLLGALRLPAGSTIIEAERQAAEINERGPGVLHEKTLVDPDDLPALFAARSL